jgi:release factor glutamine methyltransferase
MQTIDALLKEGSDCLHRADIDDALHEARLLLSHVLGCDPILLRAHGEREVSDEDASEYRTLLKKREEHMPLAYITGHKEFMSLDFDVTRDVLIPRPDTEILAEQAIAFCKSKADQPVRVLDLCCGSGCIGISVAHYAENAAVLLSDCSAEALRGASINLQKHGLDDRLQTVQSDLFESLNGDAFELIVSNPPYISQAERENLTEEITRYEPETALYGGEDGLLFYKKIIPQSINHLSKNGVLMLEIGAAQADDVTALMKRYGFKNVKKTKDYAGLDRVVIGERPES